jgi:hypothetical protein
VPMKVAKAKKAAAKPTRVPMKAAKAKKAAAKPTPASEHGPPAPPAAAPPAAAETVTPLMLGCSKCRGSHRGCTQCRSASFIGRRYQR